MRRVGVLVLLLLLAGCNEDMDRQNRLKTYGPADNMPGWPAQGEAVEPVKGTVAQGDLAREQAIATPPSVSLELLARGRQRYRIYCAPCHGLTGAGDGMIVKRGFPKPKPFDDPRIMRASAKDIMDAIGQGYGVMFSFADRVDPKDRWAIVAYVRALQLAATKEDAAP